MAKSSKGQEFLESYKDEDNQKMYDLVKEHKGKSDNEIAKKLLLKSNIKLTWQDADSKGEKD